MGISNSIPCSTISARPQSSSGGAGIRTSVFDCNNPSMKSPSLPEDRADLAIIHDQISLALLELQSIQSYRHNPTLYVELIGNALYSPYVLEYADKATRYRHIISRLKAIPSFIERAQINLASAPEIWTKVAISENDGNIALIEEEIRKQAPEELRASYDEAAGPALNSLHGLRNSSIRPDRSDDRLASQLQQIWPEVPVCHRNRPASRSGFGSRGSRHEDDARRDVSDWLTTEWSHGNSGDVNATIRRALDAIATRHATPENYFADARRDLDEARQFVRAKDLLTLPARDNLQVIETPEFMRGIYSVGGFNPAPALEPQLGAFYWITPIPKSWPKERIESKLREYNFYGLKI